MSGREIEPLSAFFPSIDRNLIRDLDRQLRGSGDHAAPPTDAGYQEPASYQQVATLQPPPSPSAPAPAQSQRPNASDILEAVDQAAASMTAMAARIQELESTQYRLDAMNAQLRTKLGEIVMAQQNAEARAHAESERADRGETIAAQHLSRAQALEADLEAALGDLHRIADAISGTLMAPGS